MEAPLDAPEKRPSVISATRRAKSHTCDGRCRIQHFSHTRTALWSFIADNHNITRHDLAALDRCNGILFAVKDSCRSFMYHHLRNNCRTFYNTAEFGARLPFRTAIPPVWLYGLSIGRMTSGFLFTQSFNILSNGLACYSHAGLM